MPQARAPKPAAQDGLTFLLNRVLGPSRHNRLWWAMLPGAKGCVPSGLLAASSIGKAGVLGPQEPLKGPAMEDTRVLLSQGGR